MSTTIRLTRMGRKKRPFYRLVVMDNRKRRDGAYLANLGYYNPFCDPFEVQLRDEEIISWLQKGARLSETARNLLQGEGVLYKYSLIREGLAAEDVAARVEQWRLQSAANRQVRQDAAAAKRTVAERAAAEAEAKVKAEAAAAEAAAQAAAQAAAAKAAAEEAAAEEAAADKAAADKAAADEVAAAVAPLDAPAAEGAPDQEGRS